MLFTVASINTKSIQTFQQLFISLPTHCAVSVREERGTCGIVEKVERGFGDSRSSYILSYYNNSRSSISRASFRP